MRIPKKELILYLYARGHQDIPGFVPEDPDFTEEDRSVIRERLMQHPFFEKGEPGDAPYRLSALGQVFLDTIGSPEAWLEVRNTKASILRRFYICGGFYVYLEEVEDFCDIDLLPTIALMIGGYASAMEGLQQEEHPLSAQPQTLWDQDSVFLQIKVCCDTDEMRLDICDNGIARKTDGAEESYVQLSEESCTNGITMWLLNHLNAKRGEL